MEYEPDPVEEMNNDNAEPFDDTIDNICVETQEEVEEKPSREQVLKKRRRVLN